MRVLVFFLLLLSIGCSKRIEITREYIINDHWNKKYNNSILIERMQIKKDSSLNIFEKDFDLNEPNHWNIVDKLETDSSFMYSYSGLASNTDVINIETQLVNNIDDTLINNHIDSLNMPIEVDKPLKKKKLKGKVFFNKYNGWDWNKGYVWYRNEKQTIRVIGNLNTNTWYKFSNLLINSKFYIYVYIDSTGQSHQFHVNLANF